MRKSQVKLDQAGSSAESGQVLRVLDQLVSLITSPVISREFDFSRVLLIGIQHLQPDTVALLQACVQIGIRHFFISGKIYSTDPSTESSIRDMQAWLEGHGGILYCNSYTAAYRRNYANGRDFTTQFELDIDQLLTEANAYLENRPKIDMAVVLDDGAKGIKLLMDRSKFPVLQKRAIVGVEQTTNGLRTLYDYVEKLKGKEGFFRRIPVVAVADALLKTVLEPSYITQMATLRLAGLLSDQSARYGIIGYGHIGTPAATWLVKHLHVSSKQIFVYDLDPSAIEKARASDLQISGSYDELIDSCDYVIGCTGVDVFAKSLEHKEEGRVAAAKERLKVILFTGEKRKTFISLSSGNIEFGSIIQLVQEVSCGQAFKRKDESGAISDIDPTDDIEWQQVKILYGGYPVNFKGGDKRDQFFRMDPIMASLFAGIIQAYEHAYGEVSTLQLPFPLSLVLSPSTAKEEYYFVSLHPFFQQYNVMKWIELWRDHPLLEEFCRESLPQLTDFQDSAVVLANSSYKHAVSAGGGFWVAIKIQYTTIEYFIEYYKRINLLLSGAVKEVLGGFIANLTRLEKEKAALLLSHKKRDPWNLLGPNLHFVGQKVWLEEIHRRFLHPSSDKPLVLTGVCGMGGIGKTYLANQVIHEPPRDYIFRVWFNASSSQSIEAEYFRLGEKELKLFSADVESSSKLRQVREWFEKDENAGWLIVYDDAEDYESLRSYLPRRGGQILITSRNVRWPEAPIAVDVMQKEDAIQLVRQVLYAEDRRSRSAEEDKAIEQLVSTLGYLPLAIAQASAYIGESLEGMTVAEYLREYGERKEYLLSFDSLPLGDRHEAVYVTWNISIERVAKLSHLAIELLMVCAYLNVEAISRSLLTPFISVDGREESEGKIEKALRLSRDYSLLKVNSKTSALTMHHLVQEVIQEQEKPERVRLSILSPYFGIRSTVLLIAAKLVYDKYDPATVRTTIQFLPHAQALLDTLAKKPELQKILDQESVAKIALKVGTYFVFERRDFEVGAKYLEQAHTAVTLVTGKETLFLQGEICSCLAYVYDYDEEEEKAADYCIRAIKCYEECHEKLPRILGIAFTMRIQGGILMGQGDIDAAHEKLKQALLLLEKVFPSGEHFEFTVLLDMLGYNLGKLKQYQVAEEYHQKAFQIRERLSGKEEQHPTLALMLAHYAQTLQTSGKLELAENCYVQALALDKKLLVVVDIVEVDYLLGCFYLKREQYDKAEIFYHQSLEEAYKLPETRAMCSIFRLHYFLGVLYQAQKKYSEAEDCYRQSLEKGSKILSMIAKERGIPVMREIGYIWQTLGDLHQRQEKYLDAEKCYLQSLDKVSGESRLSLKAMIEFQLSLGYFYQTQKRYEDACAYYHRILGIAKVKEISIVEVAHVLQLLGDISRERKEPEVASKYYDQAISMLEDLQDKHPDPDQVQILQTIRHQCFEDGDLFFEQKKWDLASVSYTLLLKIRGACNLHMAKALYQLGLCNFKQEHYEEAETFYQAALSIYRTKETEITPFERAKRNLEEFGDELGWALKFDENHTCIVGIDNKFSAHFTYEPNSEKLYVYSPLLDGLPKDPAIRLKLYESLLEGSMLGGRMLGGGVGVNVESELILIHCVLDMSHAKPLALVEFMPLFVATVERWRAHCADICAGRAINIEASSLSRGKSFSEREAEVVSALQECNLKLGRIEQVAEYQKEKEAIELGKALADVASFERAEESLVQLGDVVEVKDLKFDENRTCALSIDNTFSVHITYELENKRCYIYSPLLDDLPQDPAMRLQLYESLLESAMLGGKVAGGGVGVDVASRLILMHGIVDMSYPSAITLEKFIPIFVDTVENLRAQCAVFCPAPESTAQLTDRVTLFQMVKPDACFRRGLALFQDQDYDGAAAAFQQALISFEEGSDQVSIKFCRDQAISLRDDSIFEIIGSEQINFPPSTFVRLVRGYLIACFFKLYQENAMERYTELERELVGCPEDPILQYLLLAHINKLIDCEERAEEFRARAFSLVIDMTTHSAAGASSP